MAACKLGLRTPWADALREDLWHASRGRGNFSLILRLSLNVWINLLLTLFIQDATLPLLRGLRLSHASQGTGHHFSLSDSSHAQGKFKYLLRQIISPKYSLYRIACHAPVCSDHLHVDTHRTAQCALFECSFLLSVFLCCPLYQYTLQFILEIKDWNSPLYMCWTGPRMNEWVSEGVNEVRIYNLWLQRSSNCHQLRTFSGLGTVQCLWRRKG